LSVTIYDIAERAEVSIATVSRVFNNNSRVTAKTRERVLAVARELHYEPNVSAQSLARQNTQTISAVVPVMTNYFYMEIIRGMQDALAASHFDLIVYASPKPEESDSQLERAAQKGRADGLIILSTPLSNAQARRLESARMPAVVVDAYHKDFDSIMVDNTMGGYMATTHLIEQGYQRIGHITVFPEPLPAKQRRAGYEKALRDAGRKVDDKLCAASDRQPYGFCEEAGYEGMRVLLNRSRNIDAVFVASDIQALGALRFLQEKGVRVPQDIAVVGFDDIKPSEYVGLTTLRQPMYEMGKLAVDKLLLRIENPERPTANTVFSPQLVQRVTTRAVDADCNDQNKRSLPVEEEC
jgi:LacI family transcriptional regulator